MVITMFEKTNIKSHIIITDANSAMIEAIQLELPNTYHIHCIFYIQQNLPCKLKDILGKDYNQFICNFYKTRNSISEERFNIL